MADKENSIKQPEKKETLAEKQEKRLRRLNHFKQRLPELSPQWWVGVGEMVFVIGLVLVVFWLLLPFFGQEDRANAFSAPVVPLLTTLLEVLVPFGYGVRIWLLVFLTIFPLTFYYFVRDISGRKLTGLLAALISILPISPFLSTRVNLGLFDQDGSHIASLTMTPLICLLLLQFLRKGTFKTGILAALGMTLVALTSPLGLMILAVFMGVITFSEMLLGQGRLKVLRFLVVLLFAVGFSAFWYHPKFVFLTFYSSTGQIILKTFFNLLPVSFFLFPILGIFGFLLFENRLQLQPMFIASFLTIGFGLFSLGAGVSHPLPSRFLPAFGISLAFLIGVVVVSLFDFLRTSEKLKRLKKLYPYRRLVAFSLIIFVFLFLLTKIAFSYQSFWEMGQLQVLGLTADQKVGLWEIKEKTSQTESIFGYTITGLTVIATAILKLRLGI